MKTRAWVVGWVLIAACAAPAGAAEWFVATNGSDAAEGTNWASAKLTIQAGVDAAEAGDVVWVSDGVYAAGGRVAVGTWSNRVVVDKPIAVIGVNGPEWTAINGDGMRCVYMTNGAVLWGFTLANGTTASGWCGYHSETDTTDTVDHRGGGAYCESNAMLTNCVLTGNWACWSGGGASGGLLFNCLLDGNYSASYGGGAGEGTLVSCVLTNNDAELYGGGGAWGCMLSHCLLSHNSTTQCGGGTLDGDSQCCVFRGNHASLGGGAGGGSCANCLLVANSATMDGGGGFESELRNCTIVGNTTLDELCRGGGGTYNCLHENCIIYGNTSAACGPNWYGGGTFTNCCTTPMPAGANNVTNDPRFVDAAAGNYRLPATSPCINAGDNAVAPGDTDLDGNPRIALGRLYGRVDMGAYEFVSLFRYVAISGSDAAAGTNWTTAKQTIQAAIDAANAWDMVWVSNGVYATGGRTVGPWALTNRVAIDRPIAVQSVNGPEVTVIQGSGSFSNAMRCVYLGTNAVLSGFTLMNGTVRIFGDGRHELRGGGAYLEGDCWLTRCRVVANSAGINGGGGGINGEGGHVQNCLVAENYAEWGPGILADGMEIDNCTVCDNSSFGGPGLVATNSAIRNCIVCSNNVNTNRTEILADSTVVAYTCSPGLSGAGNVTNEPQFVDAAAGNYRLQATSPCLDAGDDSVVQWTEDLDGNPRIVYGTVDMGAYEAQLAGTGTWFGAITNGLTGDTDCAAGDGVPNLLKYAMGGSPRVADDNEFVGWLRDGIWPILTFRRNPNATDVRFVVESADAMASDTVWRGVATNVGGSWLGATNVSESGAGNPVECTVTDPVALDSNRFLRLRVNRP